jgi:hypothetical protein
LTAAQRIAFQYLFLSGDGVNLDDRENIGGNNIGDKLKGVIVIELRFAWPEEKKSGFPPDPSLGRALVS